MRQVLKHLNFSDKEIDVYLAALKMGKGLISQLAKKAGVKRPTAYVILEKLKEKGLVSLSEKKNKQIFVAENPDKLLKMTERQKEELQEKEEEIKKSLPGLKSLVKKNTGLPLFRYYEGKEGVWNILDDLTESGISEAWIILPGKIFSVFGATRFTNNVVLKRRQKGIKIYAIMDKRPESLKLYDEWKEKKDTYFREYKLMPEDIELNNVVYLYANKLALIFLKEEPSGLIIESEDLFKVFKFMFDSLWKNLG